MKQVKTSLKRTISFSGLVCLLAAGTLSAADTGTSNGASGVYVSEVVVPYVLNVDLRDLPPAPEWQPGDPIEVQTLGLAGSGRDRDPHR